MVKTTLTAFLLSAACAAEAQSEPPQPSANEIIVTARGIHMGHDVGRSEAVYSQLLKTFLVRNNIQGHEKFRDIPCNGTLRTLPTDAASRARWIENIAINLSGHAHTATGAVVSIPTPPLNFKIDSRYGPVTRSQDELTKQVRHAVATRIFDGFTPLSEYLNEITQKVCPNP